MRPPPPLPVPRRLEVHPRDRPRLALHEGRASPAKLPPRNRHEHALQAQDGADGAVRRRIEILRRRRLEPPGAQAPPDPDADVGATGPGRRAPLRRHAGGTPLPFRPREERNQGGDQHRRGRRILHPRGARGDGPHARQGDRGRLRRVRDPAGRVRPDGPVLLHPARAAGPTRRCVPRGAERSCPHQREHGRGAALRDRQDRRDARDVPLLQHGRQLPPGERRAVPELPAQDDEVRQGEERWGLRGPVECVGRHPRGGVVRRTTRQLHGGRVQQSVEREARDDYQRRAQIPEEHGQAHDTGEQGQGGPERQLGDTGVHRRAAGRRELPDDDVAREVRGDMSRPAREGERAHRPGARDGQRDARRTGRRGAHRGGGCGCRRYRRPWAWR